MKSSSRIIRGETLRQLESISSKRLQPCPSVVASDLPKVTVSPCVVDVSFKRFLGLLRLCLSRFVRKTEIKSCSDRRISRDLAASATQTMNSGELSDFAGFDSAFEFDRRPWFTADINTAFVPADLNITSFDHSGTPSKAKHGRSWAWLGLGGLRWDEARLKPRLRGQ
jgi:hypothetical protein